MYIYKAWQTEKRQFRVLLNHIKFWLFVVSACAVVLGCLFIPSCFLFNQDDITRLTISYLGGSSVMLMLSISVMINSQPFNRLMELMPVAAPFGLSLPAENEHIIALRTKLDEVMVPALFCNKNFSESMLADQLELQRYKLSELINEQYHMHFNEFVNTYRVEYFCTLVEDMHKRSKKMAVLVPECGFSSHSAFYEAFKRIKKTTPTCYIREYVNKEPTP